ncbi:MAG: tRNA guanosine(34) transglycosylase Tgt [Candidatus Roizmanbacteria bacterium]
MVSFDIYSKYKKTRARSGIFQNEERKIITPQLAIVATEGEIKGIPKDYYEALNIPYSIVNTFHIDTKDILLKIEAVNGIHNFSKLNNIVASDSGGFQVFSLGFGKAHGVGKMGIFPDEKSNTKSQQSKSEKENHNTDSDNPLIITDNDVTFEFNGAKVTLNPEKSMDIEHRIGADIMFAFDECTSPLNSKEYTAEALERTHAWLQRSIIAHKDFADKQALFGIIQGGEYEDLRKQSAQFLAQQDVPGFGIGGSLGKSKDDMHNILDWVIPYLPEEKPKHLLGIGQVRDIFEGVERGVDLFDCVIPTREGRHKLIFTKHGKISIRKIRQNHDLMNTDPKSILGQEKVTYAQLAQWFTLRDPRAFLYATIYNIEFYLTLMREIQESIAMGSFEALKNDYYKFY